MPRDRGACIEYGSVNQVDLQLTKYVTVATDVCYMYPVTLLPFVKFAAIILLKAFKYIHVGYNKIHDPFSSC